MRGAAGIVWQATEARRVIVITDARNEPALRLIRALGQPRTATLHEAGFPKPVFEWTRP